jgi:hypothetical protein
MKEGDRLEDVDVDVSGRIILRRIIGRYTGVANTGLYWLSGGLL